MNSKAASMHARYAAAIMLALSACGCQSLSGSWYAQFGPNEFEHAHCLNESPDEGCLLLAFVNTTKKDIELDAIEIYSSPKPMLKSRPIQPATWREEGTAGKMLKPGELQIVVLSLKQKTQECAIPAWAIVGRQGSKPIKIKISAALPNALPDLWALRCAEPEFQPTPTTKPENKAPAQRQTADQRASKAHELHTDINDMRRK